MDTDDSVTISGLFPLLDEEQEVPYLDLGLRCRGRSFRAAVLAADGEWTVNVRDERDRSLPGSGELYAAQADAVLAAVVLALDAAHRRLP